MEVNKVGKTGLNKAKQKQSATAEKVSFTEVMTQKRDNLTHEKLSAKMQEIEDLGKTLSESRTVEDLNKYRNLVKEFMEDAVKFGLELQERRGFNRRGRTKIYKIVEQVDKKIIELTDAVLKQEQNGLEILDHVGQIKGLLINIYA